MDTEASPADAKELTTQALSDMLKGAEFVSAGGGGASIRQSQTPPKSMPRALYSVEQMNDEDYVLIFLGAGGGVSLEEQDRWIQTPYGGIGPDARVRRNHLDRIEDRYPNLPNEPLSDKWIPDAIERAVKAGGGKLPRAFLAVETSKRFVDAIPLMAPLPLIDGDLTGGSPVPELSLTNLNRLGRKVEPIIVASPWGDTFVYEAFISYQRVEDTIRALASVSGGNVLALTVQKWEDVKDAVSAGTFSRAQEIGETLRKHGADFGKAISRLQGSVKDELKVEPIFTGRIESHASSPFGGFNHGRTIITNDTHSLEVRFKNENVLATKFKLGEKGPDGEVIATLPGAITICDAASGEPLSNLAPLDFEFEREVVVLKMSPKEIRIMSKEEQDRKNAIFNTDRWQVL